MQSSQLINPEVAFQLYLLSYKLGDWQVILSPINDDSNECFEN